MIKAKKKLIHLFFANSFSNAIVEVQIILPIWYLKKDFSWRRSQLGEEDKMSSSNIIPNQMSIKWHSSSNKKLLLSSSKETFLCEKRYWIVKMDKLTILVVLASAISLVSGFNWNENVSPKLRVNYLSQQSGKLFRIFVKGL